MNKQLLRNVFRETNDKIYMYNKRIECKNMLLKAIFNTFTFTKGIYFLQLKILRFFTSLLF